MSYTHLAIIHQRKSSTMMLMVWRIRCSPGQAACGVEPFLMIVTLNSNSEDIPSVMFEAGGRNYIHACQEVARIAIGELRDRYSDQLADTEYRYHPRQP
uniref:Uncharacterized protein n=1 Tax=Oryza sativa subsp. japonica TaxID=39947 RepID=Q6F2P0_ORYSJ|nr:unknown protein [Oryza sativa Japonica Group]